MQEKLIQKRLEKTLARYVAMPTVTKDIGACSTAIHTLADEFRAIGMAVHTDGPMHPWLIATATRQALKDKRVKVLLVIHFDVVAPTDESQFTLRLTEDKIFGRGVYDMKFAAACAKELLQEYAHSNKLKAYDFGVLITSDEEKGGYEGVYEFVEQGWTCDLAIVPDGGWGWQLERRAKGFFYLYLQANGKSAHSSRPWDGDNPINKLSPALAEIAAHFPNDDPQKITLSINSVETSSGNALNTTLIPEWAKAGISARAFTEAEVDEAQQYIEMVAKKYGLTATVTMRDSSVILIEDNPLVQAFMATVVEVHGEPLQFMDALGASDARHFAKRTIPTVVMYPTGGGFHGADEWLLRSDLGKYFTLLKKFVEKVAHDPNYTPSIRDFLRRPKKALQHVLSR